MKTFLFTTILSCILLGTASAQDTVFFKGGGQELIEVREITSTNLVFTEFTDRDDIRHAVSLTGVERLHFQGGEIYEMRNGILTLIEERPSAKYLIDQQGLVPHVTRPTFLTALGYEKKNKEPEPLDKAIKLNGPRIGFTYIDPMPETEVFDIKGQVISQFGWHFESRYFTLENGAQGLIEFVGLIGGLEQNVFLPSASMLFGYRSPNGTEVGAGPNLSMAGFGFVIAVGHTFKSDNVYFPVNLALAPSPDGVKLSLLCGFNARTKH